MDALPCEQAVVEIEMHIGYYHEVRFVASIVYVPPHVRLGHSQGINLFSRFFWFASLCR